MPVPYPVSVGGSSDYYPQQPSNVTITLPPQPVIGPPTTIPPTTTMNEPVSAVHTFQASSGPVVLQEMTDREFDRDSQNSPSPDSSGVHVYQAPGRKPVPQRAYPALIALKNGSAFTVTTYWVKGRRLHVITTQGNHIEVPFTAVDRLYPRQELDQPLNLNLTPERR